MTTRSHKVNSYLTDGEPDPNSGSGTWQTDPSLPLIFVSNHILGCFSRTQLPLPQQITAHHSCRRPVVCSRVQPLSRDSGLTKVACLARGSGHGVLLSSTST